MSLSLSIRTLDWRHHRRHLHFFRYRLFFLGLQLLASGFAPGYPYLSQEVARSIIVEHHLSRLGLRCVLPANWHGQDVRVRFTFLALNLHPTVLNQNPVFARRKFLLFDRKRKWRLELQPTRGLLCPGRPCT